MKVPLEIAFRNVEQSTAVEAFVRERVAKLSKFFRELISCRVAIEVPHRSPHKNVVAYRVRIDLAVPGDELIVSHEPRTNGEAPDLYAVIREAFDIAERRLKTFAGKLRKNRQPRTLPPHAIVTTIFYDEGYGFIRDINGQDVYFHRNSVINHGFEQIAVGDEVRFKEEQGNEGPQASTVEVVGKHGKHAF